MCLWWDFILDIFCHIFFPLINSQSNIKIFGNESLPVTLNFHYCEPLMCLWWGLFEIWPFLYLLFYNRRHFELEKFYCLLIDYFLWSAGSMCGSCNGFEETTPERWDTTNLKKGFILTGATETWRENNSKEDIENTNDRLKRKLELHRYK